MSVLKEKNELESRKQSKLAAVFGVLELIKTPVHDKN